MYYGDSIATGLGHGSRQGTPNSDAHWGRGAQATLALLNSRPEGTFRDQDIVLSTGVLNSGADWDTVRSQVNFLQGRGARSVRLVGVPNTDRYPAGMNSCNQSLMKPALPSSVDTHLAATEFTLITPLTQHIDEQDKD